MRSERDRSHEAFGHSQPPHARDAFAQPRNRPPRHPQPGGGWRLRHVAVLLLCMGVSVAGLLVRGELTSRLEPRGGDSAASAAASAPSACEPGRLPQLASVTAGQLAALRADAEAAIAPAHGYRYEWGTISPNDVWSDNAPERGALEASRAARGPGGFEVREWAPDPQWSSSYRDDIVADAFLFVTARQAQRFFNEASRASCRSSADARAAREPAHARTLSWVNPDGEREEDLYMLSGRLVYRLADVRPQNHQPPPSRAEVDEGLATVEALACGLSRMGCVHATAGGVRA
jgi:hypothetical protein